MEGNCDCFLGQLDLSPIISLGLLNFITGATAALPCELPTNSAEQAKEPGKLREYLSDLRKKLRLQPESGIEY